MAQKSMKSRSKSSINNNVAKLQSPRPFSSYLSTYSSKIGSGKFSNQTSRARSKSPDPGNRSSSANTNKKKNKESRAGR